MKKILLTGSDGFLGKRFFEYYNDRYDFILLKRNTIDITNENEVFRLFKDENIDIVFHTAAMADVLECQSNPREAYKINTQAAVNIAKGCSLKNSMLVFSGSDQIFKANKESGPYCENTVPCLGNVYAETKLRAENEIADIMERYYNLRLTWMFSMPEKNKKNKGIMSNILSALMSDKPVFLNENAYRGLTYVYEVIESFENIFEIPYGNYNFGSENNLSLYDIGLAVLEEFNLSYRSEKIICKNSGEIDDLRISTQKLKKYGIHFLSSEQAIRRCIRDFK